MKPRPPLGMGGAALVVSGSILLSRVLGLLRETLLAALLGVSAAGDVYRNAFLVPDLLNYLLAGGFLSITLIPILARRLEEGNEEQAWASFRAVFRFVGWAILGLTALLYAITPALIPLLYPRLPADQVSSVVELTRIALPAQIFFLLGGLFMAVSYVQRRFLFPALAPVIYNLGVIGGGLLGLAAGRVGPESFIWGAVAGAFVGNFALQWVGARLAGWRWVAQSAPGAAREYLALAFPLMVGQSVAVLDEQFPRLFGQLAGTGATASLSLARMLNMLPVGLIAQAAGVAAFPFLARLAAAGKTERLDQTTSAAASTAAILGLGACAAVVATAEPAVKVVYQWGRFGSGDAEMVAWLLILFSLSIPAWALHQVVSRWFYARRRMWTPVVVGTFVTVLAIPLTLLLASKYQATGIAFASTAAMWIYALVLLFRWAAGSEDRTLADIGRNLLPALGAAVPAAAAGRLVASWIGGAGPLASIPALLGGGMIVAAVLFFGGRVLHVREFSPGGNRRASETFRDGGIDGGQAG